jgi:CrcB protein
MTLGNALLVALFGGVGSLARWLLSLCFVGGRLPWATLVVNLVGALAIGLVMALAAARHQLDASWRLAITVGLLGGFTTFSSLAFETVTLLERRAWAAAAIYVSLTWLGGLGACALGLWLGRSVAP